MIVSKNHIESYGAIRGISFDVGTKKFSLSRKGWQGGMESLVVCLLHSDLHPAVAAARPSVLW